MAAHLLSVNLYPLLHPYRCSRGVVIGGGHAKEIGKNMGAKAGTE